MWCTFVWRGKYDGGVDAIVRAGTFLIAITPTRRHGSIQLTPPELGHPRLDRCSAVLGLALGGCPSFVGFDRGRRAFRSLQ
jgi:hypothetical protein